MCFNSFFLLLLYQGKVSLTAILQNTYLRAQEEKDILDEEHENIVVDDYDLIDIKVEGKLFRYI